MIKTRLCDLLEIEIPIIQAPIIVAAQAEDAIRFETWSDFFPPARESAYPVVPRVLRTAFVERWQDRPEEARAQADELRSEIMTVVGQRRPHEIVPFADQTTGLLDEVQPAGEIVERMVREAELTLERLAGLRR